MTECGWTLNQIADHTPEQIAALLGDDADQIDHWEAVAQLERRHRIRSLGLLPPGL